MRSSRFRYSFWMQFLLEVLAAIVGGVLLIAVASVMSKQARWVLSAAVARWLDIDLEIVFRDRESTQQDLSRDLETAANVSILTGRGSELQRDTFATLFLRPGTPSVSLRILLPDPDPHLSPGHTDWVQQREMEIGSFDPAYGGGLLRTQIRANIAFLRGHVIQGRAQLRLFNAPHVGRLIITERTAYYTPYRSGAHGRRSRIYKFRRGEIYDNLRRAFEQLWLSSNEIDPPTQT